MADLARLAPGLLQVGKPLPWPVYDEHGNLLVAQGYVIQNETQLERLYERGLYEPPQQRARKKRREGEDARFGSPFSEYSLLLYELENALEKVTNAEDNAEERTERLARRIDGLCRADPDACIALVHIYAVEPSAYEQTLFYAIICWFAASHFGLSETRMSLMLKASLTANIALLPYLDKLNNSRKLLSEKQRAVIRKHPELSAEALRKAGFTSDACIQIVLQHHEHFDGSGYPEGLTGEDILVEAKVMAVAERYTAMITKRAYRNRCRADEAMTSILDSLQQDPHQIVYQGLFKELTPLPPGVMVRLANDETAIVTHRRKGTRQPLVQAIASPQGKRYLGPLFRDTREEEYRVINTLIPDILPPLNLALMWGYG